MRKSRATAALVLGALVMLGPVSARAVSRVDHGDITIRNDHQFDRAHGVRSGRGTVRDPYVISGWNVGAIDIQDTTKAVRIVNNTVWSTLRLNWIGRNVLVRGNDINDLRVNENIPRWGMPASGTIEYNHFNVVGQLRHFDGMFVHNTVGTPREDALFGSAYNNQAVNFDGFNGAHFAYNTIYGFVDARLHGHHHSSGFNAMSHNHAGDAGMMSEDHTRRFHEVWIHNNHIFSGGPYAISYVDTDHAQNDRTANSETNPNLVTPHIHYTRVHILNNRLEGAGILVNVFNAKDELHRKLARGVMDIIGNQITLQRGQFFPFEWRYGISVGQARGVTLRIDRNTISSPAADTAQEPLRSWEIQGTGIYLADIDAAGVSIGRDRVTNLQSGVQATQMTKTVTWTVEKLSTSGVSQQVTYDSSVKNRPARK